MRFTARVCPALKFQAPAKLQVYGSGAPPANSAADVQLMESNRHNEIPLGGFEGALDLLPEVTDSRLPRCPTFPPELTGCGGKVWWNSPNARYESRTRVEIWWRSNWNSIPVNKSVERDLWSESMRNLINTSGIPLTAASGSFILHRRTLR